MTKLLIAFLILVKSNMIFCTEINIDFAQMSKILNNLWTQVEISKIKNLSNTNVSQNFSECKIAVDQMIESNVNDPFFRPFIEFSGKKMSDMGNYDECEKGTNTTYFVAKFNFFDGSLTLITAGSCFPDVCTAETLSLVTQGYFSTLFPFIHTNGQVSIEFQNTKEYNKIVNKLTYGFYITIVILGLYLVLVLYATFKEYQNSFFKLLHSSNNNIKIESDKLLKKESSNKVSKSTLNSLIACFSLKTNFEGIAKTESRDKGLSVFHLVRCIGMFWVVFCHLYMFSILGNVINFFDSGQQLMESNMMALLRNGSVSVDMFFAISGFFSTFSFINAFENPKNQTIKNWLLFYFHRYVRLFPMLLLGWILAVFLISPIVHGVKTNTTLSNSEFCYSRFFQTFSYTDNLITDMNKFCNNWIWYLYIDMQLFILTPFIVFPFLKNAKLGLLVLLACTLASLGYQTHLFQRDEVSAASVKQAQAVYTIYYSKTYTRCNTYFVGILFSYFYLESKGKKCCQNSFFHFVNYLYSLRIIRYCFVLFGFGLMLFMIFSINYFDHSFKPIPQYISTLYLLFFRVLFVFGLMIVLYPSTLGYGRVLTEIFGYPLFNVMAKITYGTYMLHLLVVQYINSTWKSGYYYNLCQMFFYCIEIYFIGYLISFICTAIFESPVVQLLKLLTDYLKSSPPKPKDIENQKKLEIN